MLFVEHAGAKLRSGVIVEYSPSALRLAVAAEDVDRVEWFATNAFTVEEVLPPAEAVAKAWFKGEPGDKGPQGDPGVPAIPTATADGGTTVSQN